MTTNSNSQQKEDQEPDYLNMSDDAFLEASAPPEPLEEESEDEESAEGGEEDAASASDDDGDESGAEEESDEEDESGEASESSDEDVSDEAGDESQSDETGDDKGIFGEEGKDLGEKDTSKKEEKSDKSDKPVDYQAEYQKLMTPFKANGKEMQVDSIDDARVLMQMGANYNKKMQQLKPALKVIKMLENNDLLDESKLSYLIDLDKKNPDAIKKLIKESGLDPLDIDTKDDVSYEPTDTYTVDDKEVELDSVLSELKESPVFSKTVDIISNKWDAPSKQALADNPGIIRLINEHVELGIYDKIASVVERERMMGRLTGLNDIQAYKQVGDAINDAGGFKNLSNTSNQDNASTEQKDTSNSAAEDNDRKSKKRSAKPARSGGKKTTEEKVNYLNMSDDEFEQLPPGKYV